MSKQNMIKGAALLMLSGILCKIIGAVYRVPLSNCIGETGMGNYQMAYPVYSILVTLSTSGFPIAISKLVSEAMATGDSRKAAGFFRASFWALGFLGLLGSLFLTLASGAIARASGMESAQHGIFVLGPSLVCVALVSVFRGYFQGLQQMAPTAVSQLIEQIIRMGVGLFMAKKWMPLGPEYGAAGALVGVSASELAALLVMGAFFLFGKTRPCKAKKGGGKEALAALFQIALPVTLGAMAIPLVGAIDSAMVLRLLSRAGFSAQQAARLFGVFTGYIMPLIGLPAVLSVSVAMSLVPAVSAAVAKSRRRALQAQAKMGLRLSIIIGLPCSMGMALLASPILQMLYPGLKGESLALGLSLLLILSPAIFFLSVAQIQTGILQGMGKATTPVFHLLYASILKVLLGMALIAIPGMHIKGAAWGTLACYAVVAVLNTWAVAKELGGAGFFSGCFFRPLLASLGMAGATALLQPVFAGHLGLSWGTLLSILAAILVYGILLLYTGAIQKEDAAFLPFGGRLEKRMKALHFWRDE